ncbi:MAG: glutamate-5-semialdehyde dehydrogenase [Caldicoprobacterales bacterium]|jgi:glutamate-5-semialdehyde dehydrogenase|nr:glutamate-5-semialdehyde dehydrogenase [Clostridiales bacterium]
MSEVRNKGIEAKNASVRLASLSSAVKDSALEAMAQALENSMDRIMAENQKDVNAAIDAGRSRALVDRLVLNEKRIRDMAEGLRQIKALPDPIGETVSGWTRPNGLQLAQRRVPMGVIGIIYESRPNVTADAIGLCIKTSNAVVLRGGSEAIHSNQAIARAMAEAAYESGIPKGAVQLICDTDRSSVIELMQLCGIIDVLIPRGGAGLIKTVVENSKVPVIETGVGNCHVYVDGECDPEMAVKIVVNAKTNRPGVCNAAETLLIDKKVAPELLPVITAQLQERGVELRGCPEAVELINGLIPATEEDWCTEYLDMVMAVRVVDGVEEAISHISKYGTRHSEAIVTNNYFNGQRFIQEVDAAAVYVNASTRFTDGFEFGFGAEIGISTQKLHARGPMGLKELTTIKYVVLGDGQIR